jgi:hypothetical protein
MDCFQYPDESQVVLFEVRDKEGITTYLAWQRLAAAEDLGRQIVASTSWTPDKPSTYETRLFAIVCLSCRGVLSHVATYEITVI